MLRTRRGSGLKWNEESGLRLKLCTRLKKNNAFESNPKRDDVLRLKPSSVKRKLVDKRKRMHVFRLNVRLTWRKKLDSTVTKGLGVVLKTKPESTQNAKPGNVLRKKFVVVRKTRKVAGLNLNT